MIKDIKQGLKTKPLLTLWKLCLLPVVVVLALSFALTIVLFNLGFDEAKDFLDSAF